MASVSYYKVFGPNRIGALVFNSKTRDIILSHPLIDSTLLASDLTHGGTQSMALVAAALNSLKVVSINRHNKNKRLHLLRDHLFGELRTHFTVVDYTEAFTAGPKWLLVNFSPVDKCIPSTVMFTLIRKVNDKLDAPCGFKLVKYFAEHDIIIATGSACG
jgi:cysteine sulfinate desulfinase/cysteine desulfurase-like protein